MKPLYITNGALSTTTGRYKSLARISRFSTFGGVVSDISNDKLTKVVFDKLVAEDNTCIFKDKRLFIFNEFMTAHPDANVDKYSDILYLLQSSKVIQRWYAVVLEEFQKYGGMPDFVADDKELAELWEAEYLDSMAALKKRLRELALSKKEAAEAYKLKMVELNAKLDVDLVKIVEKHPMVGIARISSLNLPVNIILKGSTMGKEEREAFFNKELKAFKTTLAKKVISGQMTISAFIDLLKVS